MARRTRRRAREDTDGLGAGIILGGSEAGAAYRRFAALPQPWQIASAVRVGSVVRLLVWDSSSALPCTP